MAVFEPMPSVKIDNKNTRTILISICVYIYGLEDDIQIRSYRRLIILLKTYELRMKWQSILELDIVLSEWSENCVGYTIQTKSIEINLKSKC